MPEDTQSPSGVSVTKWFIALLIIAVLFETIILGMAYFNADQVKCTWLWCEFTTTRGESIISRDCFQNGIRINCSVMEDMTNFTNIEWGKIK